MTAPPARRAGAIARAKQGDREALRHLYIRYADNVYSYVATILRDHHEAEDVTQQVFAKLIDVPPALRGSRHAVPELAAAARAQRGDRPDARAPRGAVGRADRATSEAPGADRERLESLRGALGALPEDQREIIVLRHLAGLAPAEIAARLHRSESAVHGLHHRGRRALRAELSAWVRRPSRWRPERDAGRKLHRPARPRIAPGRRRSARCATSGMLILGAEPRAPHGRLRRMNAGSSARPATTRAGYRAAGCS